MLTISFKLKINLKVKVFLFFMGKTKLVRVASVYDEERKRVQKNVFDLQGIRPNLVDIDKFIVLKSRTYKVSREKLSRIFKEIDKLLLR